MCLGYYNEVSRGNDKNLFVLLVEHASFEGKVLVHKVPAFDGVIILSFKFEVG